MLGDEICHSLLPLHEGHLRNARWVAPLVLPRPEGALAKFAAGENRWIAAVQGDFISQCTIEIWASTKEAFASFVGGSEYGLLPIHIDDERNYRANIQVVQVLAEFAQRNVFATGIDKHFVSIERQTPVPFAMNASQSIRPDWRFDIFGKEFSAAAK